MEATREIRGRRPILFCTLPTRWPDPFLTNSRYKGEPSPTCFLEFATTEERNEHYRTAHAEYVSDLNARGQAELFDPRYYSDDPDVKAAFDAEFPRGADRPVATAAAAGIDPSDPEDDRHEGDDEYHEPTGRADNTPSDKQIALIASLAERKGVEAPTVATKREASIAIDDLMALPDKGLRKNRYAAPCSECGNEVAEGEGVVRKIDGKWLTAHLDGCPEANLPTPITNGFYAVDAEAGHTSFYKVTNGRKPGVVFVDLLLGGGPNGGFARQPVPFRNVEGVLTKITEAGPEAAAKRFADESDKCSACGRGLTNEESRERGIGPECYRNGHAA